MQPQPQPQPQHQGKGTESTATESTNDASGSQARSNKVMVPNVATGKHELDNDTKKGNSSSQPTKKTNAQHDQSKRRVNRPGFNSYLKVILDDDAINAMHSMALEAQTVIREYQQNQPVVPTTTPDKEANENDPNSEQATNTEARSNKQKRKQKPLQFKPRSRKFFGGETICELPENELSEWHARLTKRLHKSGFFLTDSTPSTVDPMGSPAIQEEDTALKLNPKGRESKNNKKESFSFDIVDLRVFPPQRNNLVVAILEPKQPELWEQLHGDIRDIAKDETCSKALAEVTKFSKDKWVSHITLGNLFGGGSKSQVKQTVNPLLQEILLNSKFPSSSETQVSDVDGEVVLEKPISEKGKMIAETTGISMGGPIPEQVELNWDYRLQDY